MSGAVYEWRRVMSGHELLPGDPRRRGSLASSAVCLERTVFPRGASEGPRGVVDDGCGRECRDARAFDRRARLWIEANLPSWDDDEVDSYELQRQMFDAGFAGIAFPAEYGGAGLTQQHQKVFFDAAADLRRQVPNVFLVSLGIMAPTVLDHGSHELKLRLLPKLLRGDETMMQLLSEPRGGSDMAGTTTRLTRDGDTYVLNGAKMWSSNAYRSTYGGLLVPVGLGGAQAPGSVDDRGAAAGHPGAVDRADPSGER